MAYTYCPNCKRNVVMRKAMVVKLKDRRLAVRGVCAICKTVVLWAGATSLGTHRGPGPTEPSPFAAHSAHELTLVV